MSTESARYVVGIDLGTTHTVVAYAERAGGTVVLFPVPQLVSRGEIEPRELLPSFLYAPTEDEGVPGDPWQDAPWVLGEHARSRGQEVPGRLVASAKSWLCHSAVDREAAILPWGLDAEDATPRVSPVEASSRILSHVKKAWDAEHPKDPLEAQRVVLTVPASFDQAARELTLRAAASCGLQVRLLEEPQAAFYDLLDQHGTEQLEGLLAERERALVLVCDVGGGTTDLTLIAVEHGDDGLKLDRMAVGHHLLLGGDNMDLALAHLCEKRLVDKGKRLDARSFGQLTLRCRGAKERLLAEEAPDTEKVSVLGRGSQLLGAVKSTELTRAEVEQIVLDGFFPKAPRDAKPARKRAGLVAFGLPYENDPAITRHLAWFFTRHAPEHSAPHALLLNGGLFGSPRLAARLREALEAWSEHDLELLPLSDPDLAVARGAVVYGRALDGEGLRIGGGSPHGYYVGLAGGGESHLLCVVPKGAREGERHVAATHPLVLTVGKAVRFDLYASDDAAVHAPGELVPLDTERFHQLPPVSVSFGEGDTTSGDVRVKLEGELTPVGTLDLSCQEVEGDGRRFRLAFELRGSQPQAPAGPESKRRTLLPGDPRFEQARETLLRVFGKGQEPVKPRVVKDLIRDLEKSLGERAEWPMETCRSLFDLLMSAGVGVRRRSVDHERVFWMLAGFCFRPGFGHPDDKKRAKQILPAVRDGLIYQKETRSWQQLWIAYRRMAGGLPEDLQLTIRDMVDPFLAPEEERLKKPKKLKPEARVEMLDLASTLERVPAERRAALGRWLLEKTWTNRDPRIWAAIGRLGSRLPTYGSAHQIVPPKTVERWIDHLLREKWDEMPTAPRAAMLMARLSGDRARDVSESTRAEVAKALEKHGADAEWVRAVREVVPVDDQERAEFFGADLPLGLKLVEEAGG